MPLSIGPITKVYLRPGPTDLRLGFDGLYQVVRTVMGQDPQSGSVFAFLQPQPHEAQAPDMGWRRTLALREALGIGNFHLDLSDGPVNAITAAELWGAGFGTAKPTAGVGTGASQVFPEK